MKKGSVYKMLVLSAIFGITLLTLISVASSVSIWDYVKAGITGRASQQTFNLNISVGNTPPNITNIGIATTIFDPTELNATAVTFNFTVNDTDGVGNINTASARANATYHNGSTVWISKNDSCVYSSSLTAQTAVFNCTLRMWYFFPGGDQGTVGSKWNMTVYVEDNSLASAQNRTANFTYSQLKALVIAPSAFSFGSLTGGSTNSTSTNDPLILNNTGNYHFDQTTGNISVNATNLVGETNSAYSLYAGNFTVGTSTGSSPAVECGNTTWSHFMSRAQYVNLTTSNSTLPYGNLSLGGGTAQLNLFFCLTQVGSEVSAQAYSTSGPNSEGSWRVKVQT